MRDRKYLIDTVEEWYCTQIKRNVRVATALSDGSRRCLERGVCGAGEKCRNGYINNGSFTHGIITYHNK